MSNASRLPSAFTELEPFVPRWVWDNTDERVAARSASSLEEIRAFYDAMVPRLDEAIDFIDNIGLDALTPEAATLTKLVLGVGQASIAIEVHGAPIKPGTVFPHGIRVQRGPEPFG